MTERPRATKRPRATASSAELARFAAAVEHALAVATPSTPPDLLGFSIDLSVALDRIGDADRPVATGEPRCALVARVVVPRAFFASPALRARLSHLWRTRLRYRHAEAHVIVVERHRALLRFVTRTGDGKERIAVTGAIEVVPAPSPRPARRRGGRPSGAARALDDAIRAAQKPRTRTTKVS